MTTLKEINKLSLDILQSCLKLVQHNKLSASEVLRLCQVADLVGHQVIFQSARPPHSLLIPYTGFYAHLGRPDITQQIQKRSSAADALTLHASQQLAFIRYQTNASLLSKTQTTPELVRQRLRLRTSTEILQNAIRRDKRPRLIRKTLEYGSYAALTTLLIKWYWIGNHLLPATIGYGARFMATAIGIGAAVVGIRWVLRHSVMGALTLHTDLIQSPKPSLASKDDSEATRLLKEAFPASPNDMDLLKINRILESQQGVSWPLWWRLKWSRFARRFAVIAPSEPNAQQIRGQLIGQWAQALVKCRPTQSRLIEEFIQYIDSASLSQQEITSLTILVTRNCDHRVIERWLDLATNGQIKVLETPPDIQQPTAAILTHTTCLSQLTRHPDLLAITMILQRLLDNPMIPASLLLYRLAFQLASPTVSTQLISHLQRLYQDNDPYARHLVSHSTGPLVQCIRPHIEQRTSESVIGFVHNWLQLGILNPSSSIQILDIALRKSTRDWQIYTTEALKIVDANRTHPQVISKISPHITQLLAYALENAPASKILVEWNTLTKLPPGYLANYLAADFNNLVIRTAARQKEDTRLYINIALDTLNHMKKLGQHPSQDTLDMLAKAAAHSQVDITSQLRFWSRTIKDSNSIKRPVDSKKSSFASSLLD